MPLLILQFLCIGYIVFTGPIVTNNIAVLSLEVFAVFLILWTLWTIKFDRFSLLSQSTKKNKTGTKGAVCLCQAPNIYIPDYSFIDMGIQPDYNSKNICMGSSDGNSFFDDQLL